MNEAVTKRFLLYFRLMLLVWILIANAIIHVTGLVMTFFLHKCCKKALYA